jgi:hypothetical protein
MATYSIGELSRGRLNNLKEAALKPDWAQSLCVEDSP